MHSWQRKTKQIKPEAMDNLATGCLLLVKIILPEAISQRPVASSQ
jgi:hypothetical protein